MKNKGIILFLIFLALVIVAVIVGDFVSNRPDKRSANPFEYDIEEFKDVNDDLVLYRETKNFNIGFDDPKALAIENEKIYVLGDRSVKIIDIKGSLLGSFQLPDVAQTLEVENQDIYIGFKNQLIKYDEAGAVMHEFDKLDVNSYITSVTVADSVVFVADAGKRRIIRYAVSGKKMSEFEGKANPDDLHGFIIPSPYFDIDINNEGELWVVNPGVHAFENYTFTGDLRGHWEKTGINIEGFSGCCNPAHFTFLDNGNFVTSEKGLVRIKIHEPSGELLGVVAAPVKFNNQDEAPDIATDSLGNVYALDFDKKMIRVFEPK